MAQGTVWYQPIARMFQGGTNTVPNARAFFYLAGTSSPVNVYADVGLTIILTQPVVADANGVFVEIFLTPGTAYKVDIQTATGASLPGYPADNQLAVPASSSNVAQSGTAGEAIFAGQPVYLSDGSGGKIAGQWYKADATNQYSSSIAQVVGIAPASIAVGASGAFVTAGQVGGLTGITPGTDYFIGTAGALTATAPANTRYLGRADSVSTLVLQDKPGLLTSPVLKTSIISLSNYPSPIGGFGHGVCQGRLTVQSGVPVTTADIQTSGLAFAPYLGNNIGLLDAAAALWTILPFGELALPLGTLTAGLPYDVFAYNNNGVVALRPPVAWASTVARSSGLSFVSGVWLKNGFPTDRYLGTFYTTDGTSVFDTQRQRYLWNFYNRVRRPLLRKEAALSWTYTVQTWRQANANPLNQVEVLVGVAEVPITLQLAGYAFNTVLTQVGVNIGEDGSFVTPGAVGGSTYLAPSTIMAMNGTVTKYPGLGRHTYAWMEVSQALGTTTWYGAQSTMFTDAGLTGWIEG